MNAERHTMRTFIAIPIPESCLEILEQMQRHLKASTTEVRWTKISSIHLTLKFLGEVDPAIIPDMGKALADVSKQSRKFNLRLTGLGSFPNEKSPRIVWCGILGDTDVLARLQAEVETVCADFGFAAENRPFRPHLTLGRIKGRKNLKLLMGCIEKGTDLECGFRADCLNIYKSVLKPDGAVYTVLETITLP
ncbi:MAG: RNA 2',3'-cyclic phosphodiesterase [Acidobacteria bacterium]|nr:RNA 2',3'-cyclic phosphodiesterase [Acidobacteriota bacterium]